MTIVEQAEALLQMLRRNGLVPVAFEISADRCSASCTRAPLPLPENFDAGSADPNIMYAAADGDG